MAPKTGPRKSDEKEPGLHCGYSIGPIHGEWARLLTSLVKQLKVPIRDFVSLPPGYKTSDETRVENI